MRKTGSSDGFTLAEIIISLLLLSILTIGLFKTSHLIQTSANQQLIAFQALQELKNKQALSELRGRYTQITAAQEFEQLNCLLSGSQGC